MGEKVYSVGDHIQIAGHRGVALDHDIFAAKLRRDRAGLNLLPGEQVLSDRLLARRVVCLIFQERLRILS